MWVSREHHDLLENCPLPYPVLRVLQWRLHGNTPQLGSVPWPAVAAQLHLGRGAILLHGCLRKDTQSRAGTFGCWKTQNSIAYVMKEYIS